MSGIPEAKFATDWTTGTIVTTGTIDNRIYPSEAAVNGSVVRVQLPTVVGAGMVAAVAGDSVKVDWGGYGTVSVTLTSANITAKYVDVTVPWSIIQQQGYDSTVNVSAYVVGATTGNPSLAAVVPVTLGFDVALAALALGQGGFGVNGESGGNAGNSIDNAGDVNGDGIDDFVIGDDVISSPTSAGDGRAYVVFGSSSYQGGGTYMNIDLSAVAAGSGGFVINALSSDNLNNDRLGSSVAGVGDINGDGLADVMVTAVLASVNGDRNGVSWIVYGKADTAAVNLSAVQANTGGFALIGPTATERLGWMPNSTSGGGDVNGDGYTDVITSAYVPGRVFVVFGKANNTTLNMSTVSSAGAGNGFVIQGDPTELPGWSASTAGDVNGDGLSDIIVGALGADPFSRLDAGRAYVVYGKTDSTTVQLSGLTAGNSTAGFVINGQSASDGAGFAVGAAGDVNGDGLADLIVGAPDTSLATTAVGDTPKTYVVFGKTGGAAINLSNISPVTGTPTGGFVINGISGMDSTGFAVDTAGDFNGDGLADLIVGAPRWARSSSSLSVGKTFLIYGKTDSAAINLSNLAGSSGFTIVGKDGGDLSGWDVSAGGDINGDGFADLLIAAPSASPMINGTNYPQAGITYVLFGGIPGVSTTAIDFMGTTGDDTLNGTSTTVNLNEQFVGAGGDDTMHGGGGADVMYGGIGNDTFVLKADNVTQLASNTGNTAQDIARIDGGTGIDTIQLDGAGIMLDLTAIRSVAVTNVEHVDITGSGANTAKLSLTDVLQMGDYNLFDVNASASPDSRQQMMVTGNADDKVVLTDLTSWTAQAGSFSANGHAYTVYNHNTANVQLLIDQQISSSNITAS